MLFQRIDFRLPNGKRVPLKFYKNLKNKFVARSPAFGIGRISVDELFFEFRDDERVAIIYHELWHKKNNVRFEIKYRNNKPWLWLLFFIGKPILHAQEFRADMYAKRMAGKKNTLGMLIKLKIMIDKGIIHKSHEKTHPLIEERISRIKKSK